MNLLKLILLILKIVEEIKTIVKYSLWLKEILEDKNNKI